MRRGLLTLFAIVIYLFAFSQHDIHVKLVNDFEVVCDTANWSKTTWIKLDPEPGDPRSTHVKILYSKKGIYCLFKNEDRVITSAMRNDFDSLWLEDVAEVFLWPDTTITSYLEYEISPLNKELVLLITNIKGKHSGWMPWRYGGKRKTKHCTKIYKGSAWLAEFFIPYELMQPLVSQIPQAGTVWRANFYRSDRDNKTTVEWSWKKTVRSFHEYGKFGRLLFD